MRLSFRKQLPLILAVTLVALPLSARQDMHDTVSGSQTGHSLVYRFESVGALAKGSYAPFWHISNRQGLSSFNPESGYMRFAALGSMSKSDVSSIGYGADLGVGAGMQNNLILQQLYVDFNYKWLGLFMGMKERWGELKNPALSSGGLTWSGNSRPVPQVRLGLPDYVRLHILGDWFSVKTHIAYGRLTDDKWRRDRASQAETAFLKGRYTDRLLYHSKDMFLRFGNPDRMPFQATIGLEMYCIFGGTMHNRPLEHEVVLDEYKLPSGPDAYLTAFLPVNSVGNQGKENGNTLGSWHLSFDYLGNDWGVRAYYEHFFEDHSSMLGVDYKSDLDGNMAFVFYGFRRNWFDGLFGLEVNLPERLPVRNIVFEVLNTRGQCGPICMEPVFPIEEHVDGRDDIYNQELYDSYSMGGYLMGNPVLISSFYNKDCSQRLRSNRALMYHFGIDGSLGSRWDYRALVTTTSHWGTYYVPFDEVQRVTSCLLEGSYRIGDEYGWKVGLSLGLDLNDGDLTGNNTGVMLTISKSWRIL